MSIEDDGLAKLLAKTEDLMQKRVGWDESRDFTTRCVDRARARVREEYAVLPQKLNGDERAKWLQDLVEEVFADELMLLLSSGLDRSIDRLFYAFEPEIRGLLAELLKKSREDADVDACVFRTLENVWSALRSKSPEEIRGLRHIRLFCRRAARTVFWKYIRERNERLRAEESLEGSEQLEKGSSEGGESVEEEVIGKAGAQEIQECLGLLSEEYRKPLQLRYLEGRKSPEIAQLLGWSGKEGAVRVRIQIDRGLAWLRKYLEIKSIFEQSPIVVEGIKEYVRTLSSFTEAVLRVHFMDHCTIASIAARLGKPERMVRGRLFRAVNSLHAYVEVQRAFAAATMQLNIRVLPEEDGRVVRAHFLEHRPLEHIALERGLKEKQVMSSLQRGVRLLHQQLHTSGESAIENRSDERE